MPHGHWHAHKKAPPNDGGLRFLSHLNDQAGTRTQNQRLKRPMLYQLSYPVGVARHFEGCQANRQAHELLELWKTSIKPAFACLTGFAAGLNYPARYKADHDAFSRLLRPPIIRSGNADQAWTRRSGQLGGRSVSLHRSQASSRSFFSEASFGCTGTPESVSVSSLSGSWMAGKIGLVDPTRPI